MGEGNHYDPDGVTVIAEPCDDLGDDADERADAWNDLVGVACAALTHRWRRAGSMWRDRAAVLARSGLHLLTLYEDSYSRAHITIAVRSDLEPPLQALARAQLDRTAERVFAAIHDVYPLRQRLGAWTSGPWAPKTPTAPRATPRNTAALRG